jgi:hypothetical protein
MFRMIKLAAYILFGYFLYEAVRGIAEPRRSSSKSQLPSHGHREEMKSVPVYDPSGAQRTEKVGRGIIS